MTSFFLLLLAGLFVWLHPAMMATTFLGFLVLVAFLVNRKR